MRNINKSILNVIHTIKYTGFYTTHAHVLHSEIDRKSLDNFEVYLKRDRNDRQSLSFGYPGVIHVLKNIVRNTTYWKHLYAHLMRNIY